MALNKVNYEYKKTNITSENMNDIQDCIIQNGINIDTANEKIDKINTSLDVHETEISTLKTSISDTAKLIDNIMTTLNNSISSKNVTIPDNVTLEDYASLIDEVYNNGVINGSGTEDGETKEFNVVNF